MATRPVIMEMKTYGSKETYNQQSQGMDSVPEDKVNGWRNSEFGLLFLSPGFPCVVAYVLVCYNVSLLVPLNIRPYPGEFLEDGDFVKDPTSDHPDLGYQTVPFSTLLWVVYGTPFIVIPLVMYLAPVSGDLRAVVYGFASAMASTNMITNCAKNYVGRLRPFYYQKCGFDTQDFTCRLGSPMSDYIRQSFPSGHSSLSMCSMLFLTLYLLGKINLAKSYHGRFVLNLGRFGQLRYAPLIAIASTSLVWLSLYISISRIHDNWHHPSDVIAGSTIGAAVAIFFYHIGYTSIMDVDAPVPLVSRARKSSLIYFNSPQFQETQELVDSKIKTSPEAENVPLI